MNGWNAFLACALCLVLGIAFGIGFALLRPGSLRPLAKKLKLPDQNQEWFYQQTVAFHRRMDGCVPNNAVLFIGDSFVQGLCVSEVAANAINYGIGGDTTEGVLARLAHYQSLNRAGAVVIGVGENDLRKGRAPAEIVRNYRQIASQLPEKISLFFCSMTPCTKSKAGPLNDAVMKLNPVPKELCESHPNCHFVDLNETVCGPDGFLLADFADTDGSHLNARGNRACIEKLRATLRELAPRVELAAAN